MTQENEAEPPTIVLHRGQRYCVRFLRCNDTPRAVVCFEYWVPGPTLDGPFAAEGFFRHRGTNAIGILAAENDWFQHGEIEAVLQAVRAATAGFALVGYGGSMGGFAAITFSERLGLRSVVAVCPQYSIDPARAPYETRWRGEAARIAADSGFAYDRVDQVKRLERGWLIYDPACVDARHAADIQARHGLGELRVRFGGHDMMLMLQQADVYTAMLVDMLEDRFDQAAFVRRWRQARCQSAVFQQNLSEAVRQREARPKGVRGGGPQRGQGGALALLRTLLETARQAHVGKLKRRIGRAR